MLNLVRPKYFVPVHGEYRQMAKHAAAGRAPASFRASKDSFVLETGDMLEIDEKGARKAGKVTVGRVCIDSGTVDEVVEDIVIRDRRHLSEDGIVLPIVAINKHTGRSEMLPEVVTRGFSIAEDGPDLIQAARMVVARRSKLRRRRDGRLGRHEGKDPRRSETLYRQADPAPPVDHARDSRGLGGCWLKMPPDSAARRMKSSRRIAKQN